MSKSCSCKACTQACNNKPGWFKPGEAEKVAKHLGISLKKLFNKYLGVDWYEGDENDMFLLAPAITTMKPGGMYPANPAGQCVFFGEDDKCMIHPVKPHECRMYIHGDDKDTVQKRHKAVAKAWNNKNNYEQIEKLLGYEPESKSFSIFDSFGLFGF